MFIYNLLAHAIKNTIFLSEVIENGQNSTALCVKTIPGIDGLMDLHIILYGDLTFQRYADEMLRPHVIPCTAPLKTP